MLNQLTAKQTELLDVVKKEWIDRLNSCTLKTDRKQATKYINWLYKLSGYKNPMIIFLSSPLAAQFGCNFIKHINPDQVRAQVGAQVGDQVRAQVRDQVWAQVRDQVRAQVGAQVGDQVRAQVGAQVGAQVWAQVGTQVRDQVGAQVEAQVGDQKMEFFGFCSYGSITDYGWVSFYDFFTRIGILNNEKLNNFIFLLKSGIYDMVQFEKVVFVSDMPIKVARDDRNRLHNAKGHAIEWSDGYYQDYLSGVYFNEKLFKKVTNPKATLKTIFSIENMEQRMAALKHVGVEKLLKTKDAKRLDRSNRGNELYQIKNVFSRIAYYLKYTCPSTGRVYVSGVDPEIGAKNDADLAMSWKFSISKEEYISLNIES